MQIRQIQRDTAVGTHSERYTDTTYTYPQITFAVVTDDGDDTGVRVVEGQSPYGYWVTVKDSAGSLIVEGPSIRSVRRAAYDAGAAAVAAAERVAEWTRSGIAKLNAEGPGNHAADYAAAQVDGLAPGREKIIAGYRVLRRDPAYTYDLAIELNGITRYLSDAGVKDIVKRAARAEVAAAR